MRVVMNATTVRVCVEHLLNRSSRERKLRSRTTPVPNGLLRGVSMGDEADPEWVIQTQQTLGELIKRPKLTGALLQKPPFRFLHDIVSEVTKVTGFASGLYQEDELQSAKIKVCARVAPMLALRSRAQ